MSTFNGIVEEFPQIRIDYFRKNPDHPPPLACFLSHVHSDHLYGLESLRSPFVYCSPTTRQILLNLEKYPHRMNFAKGILESRLQTYKPLRALLKTIPLDTPTEIELSPGYVLRVTLFDANHCPGAVSFLIEGQGRAVLYTGDVRAEQWWVDELCRKPAMVPYAHASGLRRLDRVYLDTTFGDQSESSRRFESKAEGVRELLQKVRLYPRTTRFHLRTFTFGYEPAMLALSHFLDSPIHLDTYKLRVYGSLADTPSGSLPCPEAPQLCGFRFGNRAAPGCFTADVDTPRIHACERGAGCPTMAAHFAGSADPDVVAVIPIVGRLRDGTEVRELGAGGGSGDLRQRHELDVRDAAAVELLVQYCVRSVANTDALAGVLGLIAEALRAGEGAVSLQDGMEEHGIGDDEAALDDIPLVELVAILESIVARQKRQANGARDGDGGGDSQSTVASDGDGEGVRASVGAVLPRIITFPYARHSSYEELCGLLAALRPKDVYPCTIDEASWTLAGGIKSLYGHLCSDDVFAHDELMLEKRAKEMN